MLLYGVPQTGVLAKLLSTVRSLEMKGSQGGQDWSWNQKSPLAGGSSSLQTLCSVCLRAR